MSLPTGPPGSAAAAAAVSSSSGPPLASAGVVPAHLGFLAIFNPSLGTTDETIDDQIVYYASVDARTHELHQRPRHRRSARGQQSSGGGGARPTDALPPEERNERLRQIGLAQGMVDFSRGFAGGKAVEAIETEKTRVVLHELEPGWWILTSIDLTRLPLPPRLGSRATDSNSTDNVEYSSREVKPAALLLKELLRAHSIFLLHHAPSLSALFVRSKRSRFAAVLGRYWDLYLSTWSVMLHGNPASAVFGGIKMAACGELGIGVGEEERGSGEREVLEGFVDRTDGLVDLVVSKFGEADPDSPLEAKKSADPLDPSTKWLGLGEEPGAEDGAIFLGVGALSRKSLRDVTFWMEDLYTWGEHAYGVKDSPTSTRFRPRRARAKSVGTKNELSAQATSQTAPQAENNVKSQASSKETAGASDGQDAHDDGGMNKVMNYLKLGYGTHWSLGSSGTNGSESVEPGNASEVDRPGMVTRKSSRSAVEDNQGHFLIGLQGDVEETSDSNGTDDEELESRTHVRTLTVELESEAIHKSENSMVRDLGSGDNELSVRRTNRLGSSERSAFDSQDRNKTKKMRVVVYVSKPFVYVFLFTNRTESLALDSLYRSLHYQLAPLRKTLAVSTAYRPDKPNAGGTASHIFDLIWDARALTVHSTIPSIPDPLTALRQQDKKSVQEPWSRVEALNTHIQILNTYSATRDDDQEHERTCKTSRGWWMVWTRILATDPIAGDSAAVRGLPSLPTEDSQESSGSMHSRSSDQGIIPELAPPSNEAVTKSSSERTARPNDSQEVLDADSGGDLQTNTPTTASNTVTGESQPPSQQQHQQGSGSGNNNNNSTTRRKKKIKVSKEIFLVRRAGEGRWRRASLAEDDSGAGGGWADGASRLAQGIGVDTRKYIEGLLSMGAH